MANAVAKKTTKGTELSEDMLSQFEQDGGDLGFTPDDLIIPFLRILQALSPQLNSRNALYIPEAKQGDFLLTATQEIMPGSPEPGLIAVPVFARRSYTEWIPREQGGGLVNDFGTDDSILSRCTKDDRNRDRTPDGHIIKSSYLYFVLLRTPQEDWTQAVIDFASTQRRKARTWNTRIQSIQLQNAQGHRFNPPMFYMSWKLSTVAESNDQGDWFGFKIDRHMPTHELDEGWAIYEQARDFRDMVKEEKVKADPNADAGDDDVGRNQSTPGGRGGGHDSDDDIPF